MTMPPATAASEMMNAVTAIWGKAAAGPKKDAALWHYWAADKALINRDDARCIRELTMVTRILG